MHPLQHLDILNLGPPIIMTNLGIPYNAGRAMDRLSNARPQKRQQPHRCLSKNKLPPWEAVYVQ